MSSKKVRSSQACSRSRGRRTQLSQERFNPLSRPRSSATPNRTGPSPPLRRALLPTVQDQLQEFDRHRQPEEALITSSLNWGPVPPTNFPYSSGLESSHLELQPRASPDLFGGSSQSSQSEAPTLNFDFNLPLSAFSDNPTTNLVLDHIDTSSNFHPTSNPQLELSLVESVESMYSIANPYPVNLATAHQFDASVDELLSQPRAFSSLEGMLPHGHRPGAFPHQSEWSAPYIRSQVPPYYGQQSTGKREDIAQAASATSPSYSSHPSQTPVYQGVSYPLGFYPPSNQPYYPQNTQQFNQTPYQFTPNFLPQQSYSTSPNINTRDTRGPPTAPTYLPTTSSGGGTPEPESQVRVIESRPKPQCWDHGCNGREFSTFSNLLRHQRERSGAAAKSECPHCGAVFTRTTARNTHIAQGKCKGVRELD